VNLDEALAVYEYLKRRPATSKTKAEAEALEEAWRVICYRAERALQREASSR
jgi:hypothetical protein